MEQRYAVRCRAAYLQARTEVVLSHTSALPFIEAPAWGFDLAEVHLTRRDGNTGRREAGIRQHCGVLQAEDVMSSHGIDVTSPVRAALEATLVGTAESALIVVNHLLHERVVTLDALRARYDNMGGWPNSLVTDLVLRLADPRIASVGESRTFSFLFARKFPRPVPQYEVHDRSRLVAILDFALPDLGVWIEFDGRIKYHRHLRPGETAVDAVLREKRREELVAELTGWRCLRVTWSDLAAPDELAARLRRLIASVAATRRSA